MQQTFAEWCRAVNAWRQEPWILVLALPLSVVVGAALVSWEL